MPQRDSASAEKMLSFAPVAAGTRLPAIQTCRAKLREPVDTAFGCQGKPEAREYAVLAADYKPTQ